MDLEYRTITDPGKDIFRCPCCDIRAYRYEGTKLEIDGDPKINK